MSASFSSLPSAIDVWPTNRMSRLGVSLVSILMVSTFALYARTARFQFINFDDQHFVYANAHVLMGLSLQNIRWAATAVITGNWQPLTVLVRLSIITLFGTAPTAHHMANALLHTLNVVLLFVFLLRTTDRMWPAFFAAALWGLHPLRVESVAWVSELKDVLCGTFWLACMLAYVRYSSHRNPSNYVWVAILLACALLSKPMANTLPFALLLIDYWPLGRDEVNPTPRVRWWMYRVTEKIPLMILSALDSAVTLRTQFHASHLFVPTDLRLATPLASCVDYLRDSFFPHHLSIFYPDPALLGDKTPAAVAVLSAGILMVITLFAILRIRRQPSLIVGWFWFLGTLVPVIGFVQAGEQSRADRYTYIPTMGLTWAIVWLISDWTANQRRRQLIATAVGLAAAIVLSVATVSNIGHWRDTDTLFHYALNIDPNNFLADVVLASEEVGAGRNAQAMILARRAIDIAPTDPGARYTYAVTLRDSGQLEESAKQFKKGIEVFPGYIGMFSGLGTVRHLQASRALQNHDHDEMKYRALAIQNFRAELAWNPDDPVTAEKLGYELAIIGKLDDAIAVWQAIIRANPGFAEAHGDLADAFRVKGDVPAAVEQYREAIGNGSKDPDWETNLVYMLATDPNASPAALQPLVAVAKDAVRQTNSKQVGPLEAYGVILARLGRYDDAVAAAKQAVLIANAAGQTSLAKSIDRQIARYLTGQSFVNGD